MSQAMCGIAGVVYTHSQRPVDGDLLRRMTDRLAHRGPDGQGAHVAPGVGLGIRRLSIIDLETGDQPLANEDGTVVVVCNGEIYNFVELRAELERRGHHFQTRSDVEVIPHLRQMRTGYAAPFKLKPDDLDLVVCGTMTGDYPIPSTAALIQQTVLYSWFGNRLVKDPRIKGVAFTGSSETAWVIQRALSDRRSAIVPFIAETGGINAMIADSSALIEQVVNDAIRSAFNSAGQRCSAARIFFVPGWCNVSWMCSPNTSVYQRSERSAFSLALGPRHRPFSRLDWPVRMLARVGAHSGLTRKRVKRSPLAARASRCGVRRSVAPLMTRLSAAWTLLNWA